MYNRALTEFEQIPESTGTLTQRVRKVRGQLPSIKDWWDERIDVCSAVSQAAVIRIEGSIKALSQLKQNGYVLGASTGKHSYLRFAR